MNNYVVVLNKEFETEKAIVMKSLNINTIWILDELAFTNTRYVIFPLHNEESNASS